MCNAGGLDLYQVAKRLRLSFEEYSVSYIISKVPVEVLYSMFTLYYKKCLYSICFHSGIFAMTDNQCHIPVPIVCWYQYPYSGSFLYQAIPATICL